MDGCISDRSVQVHLLFTFECYPPFHLRNEEPVLEVMCHPPLPQDCHMQQMNKQTHTHTDNNSTHTQHQFHIQTTIFTHIATFLLLREVCLDIIWSHKPARILFLTTNVTSANRRASIVRNTLGEHKTNQMLEYRTVSHLKMTNYYYWNTVMYVNIRGMHSLAINDVIKRKQLKLMPVTNHTLSL